jgi:NADPH:quinone reductase-like Zn-dependent oxidoreductase
VKPHRTSVLVVAAGALALSSAVMGATLSSTMLAAAIDHGGGPEVLQIHSVPIPVPSSGEVLISMRAAGIGVWEVGQRRQPDKSEHFPLILGLEGSGVVSALGPDVHEFKVGDEVYGEVRAPDAQFALAQEEKISRIPKGVSFTDAAALGISGLSAMQGIDDLLRIRHGDTIIIHGASGAVGTFAVQFAKYRGAHVLATVTDDAGARLVSQLGADAVVNGKTGDIATAARNFAPQGVDAVLGLSGGPALEQCIDALRKDGLRRVAYLYGMHPLPMPRNGIQMLLYSYIANPQEFLKLNQLVRSAHLKIVTAGEYPLDQAAEAHGRLESGHLLGKLILQISPK